MDINQACEAFRILLQEQQIRIANMAAEKVDFSTKETVTIGIIPGDGIGPIIMEQAVKILEHLLNSFLTTTGRIVKMWAFCLVFLSKS